MTNDTAICSRCVAEKPFDAFHKSRATATGLHRWCKNCRRKHDSGDDPIENDRRLALPTVETDKCCRTCREWKTPEHFALLRGRHEGRRTECLQCGNQRAIFKQCYPLKPKISYPQGYGKDSRLLRIHHHMRSRCNCSTDANYKNYGGRGITVCQEWNDDYVAFLNWALSNGYADHLTIERINNDGPYAPDNCRWATQYEQSHNQRTNVFATAWGETKTISEWARDPRCLVSRKGLHHRLNKGFSAEDAMTKYSLTAPKRGGANT